MIDNLTFSSGWPNWGRNHANFFGWCALDEVDWFWAPYEYNAYKGGTYIAYSSTAVQQIYNLVDASYDRIKAQDTNHVVIMNFAPAHGAAFLPYQNPGPISYSGEEAIVNGK